MLNHFKVWLMNCGWQNCVFQEPEVAQLSARPHSSQAAEPQPSEPVDVADKLFLLLGRKTVYWRGRIFNLLTWYMYVFLCPLTISFLLWKCILAKDCYFLVWFSDFLKREQLWHILILFFIYVPKVVHSSPWVWKAVAWKAALSGPHALSAPDGATKLETECYIFLHLSFSFRKFGESRDKLKCL